MPVPLIYGAAIVAGLWFLSDASEKAGEGTDAAGNGALKLLVAAGGAYALARWAKIL